MGVVAKYYWRVDFSWPYFVALALHFIVCGLCLWSLGARERARIAAMVAAPLLLGGAWFGGLLWLHTALVATCIGLLLGWQGGRLDRQGAHAAATIMGVMALAQSYPLMKILLAAGRNP